MAAPSKRCDLESALTCEKAKGATLRAALQSSSASLTSPVIELFDPMRMIVHGLLFDQSQA